MPKLVIDIETIGVDFESLDETSKKLLKNKADNTDDPDLALEETKDQLGLSPTTGEIVAIGVLDIDRNQGAVYFQDGGTGLAEKEENGIKYKPMTEQEMLTSFWVLSNQYTEFVTFNGRGFDIPYMMIRSAVHGVRVQKNLMDDRYLNPKFDNRARHIDLYDQLKFYNSFRSQNMSLHFLCKAFGIPSPKESEVDGGDVGALFRAGEYEKIARYNAGDIRATAELFKVWEKYMRF